MNKEPVSFRLTAGQLNELVESLMRQIGTDNPNEAVELIISGKYLLTKGDGDDILYVSVTTDGTTGPEWIKRLEGKGCVLPPDAKNILQSPDFKVTTGVTTKVAVLKSEFFPLNKRTLKSVRAEADRRSWTKLNAEVACLMRELLTEKKIRDMGLSSITVMHDPIDVPDRGLKLLCLENHEGMGLLGARSHYTSGILTGDEGIAYAAS